VNFAATTGKDNRWSAELNHNILYSRRPAEDSKLLVYTGNPLTADVEITGSPVVVLDVTSTNTDADFFAYLEDLAPEGQVTLVNEGELRAACRDAVGPEKPSLPSLAPVSKCSRDTARALIPGEPTELRFWMWPTSVLLRKGHRIRLALAGADVDSFRRYPPAGDVTWTVYRQSGLASHVELPMRPR
jgi:hypothetical protein